ncbi:Ubiquitin carboxyl-terminal hydrolase 13, partial [Mucuna pruriens]
MLMPSQFTKSAHKATQCPTILPIQLPIPFRLFWSGCWQVIEMVNMNEKPKLMSEKFTWTIRNFSKLYSKKLYSEKRILVSPTRFIVGYLSIYLYAAGVNLPFGWRKFANFKLILINQVNEKMTKIREITSEFNEFKISGGFTEFVSLDELCDSRSGFIVNDTCIIEVEMLVRKSKQDQSVSNIDDTEKPIKFNNSLPKETFITSFGEPVDFHGLGKIEQVFIPLLEEVCSQHPSLINSQKKRTHRFIKWAFIALGRVLHFLKTKKVKDMGDDACDHLQILWEELETFKFDLTWLEPYVQSALGMKNYAEKAVRVKRMEENVAALEIETKRLKAKMVQAELDLELASKDLVKAKEGLDKCKLDAELGYGVP